MRKKSTDPIEQFLAVINSPRNVAKVTRTYQQRWKALTDDRTDEADRKADWAPIVKAIRARFRAEFPRSKWPRLALQFVGNGYATDWSTRKTTPYIKYEGDWRGLSFMRSFQPTCMADVTAEAKRLAGALLAWKDGAS